MLQKWLLGMYPGDNGRAGDQGVVGVTGCHTKDWREVQHSSFNLIVLSQQASTQTTLQFRA